MNSERQAELQRKLSMGAVPRPPADLADRIKADIPKYLEAHAAPKRFPWTLTMRVAASLLLLLTSALVTRELMQPRYKTSVAAVAEREKLVPPMAPPGQKPAPQAAVTSSASGTTEITLDVVQDIPASAAPAAPVAQSRVAGYDTAAGANAATPREERAAEPLFVEDAVQETTIVAEAAPAPAPPPPPPAVAPAPAAPQQAQVAEAAPSPVAGAASLNARRRPSAPAMAPAPVPPPPVQTADAATAEKITVTASAPSIVPEAYAYSLDLHPTDVFGISVDPKAFTTVRNAIENGSRPAAAAVDVEALVNYFAGGRKPSRDVALEVEASPAPIEADGDRAILRFTVDTARMTVAERASVPPIARDAHLHVDIDPRAVASFRRIGDDGSVEAEDALLYNTSVTGLYELQLKPNLRPNQRVATIELKYTSIKTGKPASIAKVIHRHDLARTWDGASRRHRLAALGALWSETLRGTGSSKEVAQRAEELATQNPRDERARELADAANASTGGGR